MTFLQSFFVMLFISWNEVAFLCNSHPRVLSFVNHTADALERLLQVFGLEEHLSLSDGRNLSPPKYMMDLYHTFSGRSLAGDHHHQGANTVRCLFNTDFSKESDHYYFNLSNAILNKEELLDAQFHLYIHVNSLKAHQSSHVIQLRLYDRSSSQLLEARLISAHASGWETFKITPWVKRWIQITAFNKGLSIDVLDVTGKQWAKKGMHHLFNYRRPILILFSKDTKIATNHPNVPNPRIQPIERNQNVLTTEDTQSMRSTRSAATNVGDCARHELRVDFEKLGWSAWIISPKWYNAYVCAGTCSFPLGQNQRPTNHATVQSIVHELGIVAGINAPCCAPTELQPVSLLYFDEYMNVVLKQYDDMIAAGCGCQ